MRLLLFRVVWPLSLHFALALFPLCWLPPHFHCIFLVGRGGRPMGRLAVRFLAHSWFVCAFPGCFLLVVRSASGGACAPPAPPVGCPCRVSPLAVCGLFLLHFGVFSSQKRRLFVLVVSLLHKARPLAVFFGRRSSGAGGAKAST